MAKWAIELEEHDISYRPRISIKGQALTDFLLEISGKPKTANQKKESLGIGQPKDGQEWTLYTEGASSKEGLGAGLVLTSLEGEEITYALRFNFHNSKNEDGYEALLADLRIAK